MSTCRALAIILITAFLPAVAEAWEADTHYGLIKWLAYHSGFSLTDAEIVAASSESADETHVLMATYLVAEVCARAKAPKITTISRVVQQHHFPAPEHVPNQPSARAVQPGQYAQSNGGNRWTRQEILDRTRTLSPPVRLERFGSSLHPLADSWSHAGHPDVPDPLIFRCRRPELVWSHPRSRGGWKSHDADLTYLHLNDTLETAETAHQFMIDFLQVHRQFAAHPSTKWASIEPRVRDFARRATRDAKFDWFMSEDELYKIDPDEGLPYDAFTTYPCFLEETSLEKRRRSDDHERTRCAEPEGDTQADGREALAPPPLPLENKPESPWFFAYDLLDTWLVSRNIEEVLDDMSNMPSITSGYATGQGVLEDRDLVEVLLQMFLIEDHGVVNRLGHGGDDIADLREALRNPFFTAAGPLPQATYDSLAEVASSTCSSLPFDLIRNDFDSKNANGEPITIESYLVTFRLRHAPRDLMLLTIERWDDKWQLTSIAWATQ